MLIILGFAYFSFNLYITTIKAERGRDDTKQWAYLEAASTLRHNRQTLFTAFLGEWQQGRDSEAKAIAKILYNLFRDSKEKQAAQFLLNPGPLAEKESDFRQALTEEYAWLADFIVGEYHYREGNRKEALEAYQRCYGAIRQIPEDSRQGVGVWLVRQLMARLGDLDNAGADKPAGETE